MDKKEYLTEENYEKGKKKLAKAIKIVLCVGLSLSLLLILSGIIVIATSGKKEETKEPIKEEVVSEKEYESKVRSEEEINNDIAAANNRINEINQQLPGLNGEQQQEFRNSGFSTKYYELEQKISDLESEKMELESKKSKLQFELSTRQYKLDSEQEEREIRENAEKIQEKAFDIIGEANPKSLFGKGIGIILIYLGFALIAPTLFISGLLYFIYKRREIKIFTTQQTMPVTQEIIDKMAPTVGDAVGTVSQSIAEGITKGIKEGKTEEENK